MIMEPSSVGACAWQPFFVKRSVEGLLVATFPYLPGLGYGVNSTVEKAVDPVDANHRGEMWLKSYNSCGEISTIAHASQSDRVRVYEEQIVFVVSKDVVQYWCHRAFPIVDPIMMLLVEETRLLWPVVDYDVVAALERIEGVEGVHSTAQYLQQYFALKKWPNNHTLDGSLDASVY